MTTHSPAAAALAEDVRAQIDPELLRELCRRLVEAPSVNPPGDTRGVAAVVHDALAEAGLAPELVFGAPTMPSVVATVEGGAPGPHLVLNVHLDTMEPGDVDAWTVDPYALTPVGTRLYGLGMGNMKGAVAAMAHAFHLVAAQRDRWAGRLTFTAVADEVVFGDHGAAHLLATRPDLVGDALLCGEGPGWMRLAVAEKGVLWLELSAVGVGGHSSGARPGRSAIARLARLVSAVDALGGRAPALPADLSRPPHGVDAADAEDVARLLTVNVGTIAGGTFTSQLPRAASATVDLRLPPGTSCDELEAEVTRLAAGIDGTSVRRIKGWDPNWTDPEHPFVGAVRDAATVVRGEAPPAVVRLPASDASRWRARGVPAVCYGPQPTLSAGVDDYAEETDVIDCARVYASAMLAFLPSHSGQGGARGRRDAAAPLTAPMTEDLR